MLATTEQAGAAAARRQEVEEKLRRLRGWLAAEDLPGAVLAGADAVAWLTGGLTSPVERGAALGPLQLAVTDTRVALVTTNIERPRLAAEADLAALGIELAEAPWYEPESLERAALELAGYPRAELASDRLPGYARRCDDDLVALRLALTSAERERLALLARDTALALEEALWSWRPGELDHELRARADEALERRGAFAACLIVGGDGRVERYRHPLARGAPMRTLVMAVAVAERDGLHAAATRFACADGLAGDVRAAREAACAVEESVLAACLPGATYGEVLAALEQGYRAVGAPGAWRDHYQGGPIGYRQREFEIVPGQTESRWFATPLAVGHALAWNPSLPGGGKAEDTYLLGEDGLERLTESGRWPLSDGRPAILDIARGEAA